MNKEARPHGNAPVQSDQCNVLEGHRLIRLVAASASSRPEVRNLGLWGLVVIGGSDEHWAYCVVH